METDWEGHALRLAAALTQAREAVSVYRRVVPSIEAGIRVDRILNIIDDAICNAGIHIAATGRWLGSGEFTSAPSMPGDEGIECVVLTFNPPRREE